MKKIIHDILTMNTESKYNAAFESNNYTSDVFDYESNNYTNDVFDYESDCEMFDYIMNIWTEIYDDLEAKKEFEDTFDLYQDYDIYDRMLYRLTVKNMKHSNNNSESKGSRVVKRVLATFGRKNIHPKYKGFKQTTDRRSFMYDIAVPVETDQKIYNGDENFYMCGCWFDDYLMNDSHFWNYNDYNGYCTDDESESEIDYESDDQDYYD